MADALTRKGMRRVELNECGPRIIAIEQHRLCGAARTLCGALRQEPGVACVLDVDHAEMARAPEQGLGRVGVFDGHDAVGDLDQRARELLRLDAGAEKASARYSRVRLR